MTNDLSGHYLTNRLHSENFSKPFRKMFQSTCDATGRYISQNLRQILKGPPLQYRLCIYEQASTYLWIVFHRVWDIAHFQFMGSLRWKTIYFELHSEALARHILQWYSVTICRMLLRSILQLDFQTFCCQHEDNSQASIQLTWTLFMNEEASGCDPLTCSQWWYWYLFVVYLA